MIRKIIRSEHLVETNSSSTHSVAIDMSGDYLSPSDTDWDLDIRDNVLHVNCPAESFGWSWETFTGVESRIQYVCGLLGSGRDWFLVKKVRILKKVLIDFLGVRDVIFEWEFEEKDTYGCLLGVPEIDHQSIDDMSDEILETKETLKNFIFGKLSTLYTGNDNSDPMSGIYKDDRLYKKESDNFKAIASIDFGNNGIGRVDFEVSLSDPISDIVESREIDRIIVNKNTGEVKYYSGWLLSQELSNYNYRFYRMETADSGELYAVFLENECKKGFDKYTVDHYKEPDRMDLNSYLKSVSREDDAFCKFKVTISSPVYGMVVP